MRFWAYNPDTEAIYPGATLVVGDDRVVVESVGGDKFLILELEGYTSREQADALKNREAGVAREDLPPIDEDEFYLVDVIGFDVVGRQTEKDEPETLGKLTGFLDSTSVDVFIVQGPRIHKRLLVPMTDDALVDIDHDEGIVTLHPFDAWMPEGETPLRGDQ